MGVEVRMKRREKVTEEGKKGKRKKTRYGLGKRRNEKKSNIYKANWGKKKKGA